MLSTPIILMITVVGVAILSVLMLISTGGVLPLIIGICLIAIFGYLLYLSGVLKFTSTGNEFDIKFYESAPAPGPAKPIIPASKGMPLEKKEVFFVEGNKYTYDEASAVCAAYESDLATYDQVSDAYKSGAEWCGYGWSQGGMALFPTQKSTWETLQTEVDTEKRTACGRPGVNGGYFDPQHKFGVNCYGVKPTNTNIKFPQPIPGTDPSAFDNMVRKFKKILNVSDITSFNRDAWSEWNNSLSSLDKKTHTELDGMTKIGDSHMTSFNKYASSEWKKL